MPLPSLESASPIPDTHRSIVLRLTEQIQAGTLPDDLLICGPAGTGKTYAILAVLHCLAHDHAGLRILMCRATRASMTESVLVTFEQEILPADGCESIAAGVMRRVRQSYRYPSGSEIVVGGLDNPLRILSTSWDIVYINEAIEVTEDAWGTLSTRLNRPGRHAGLGYLLGDTNPGSPSHWLKQRADKGLTALWDTSHHANPTLHDGTDWTAAGRAYRAKLDKLTGHLRDRLRDGLWVVVEGLVYPEFTSCIVPAERWPRDLEGTRLGGIDWGWHNPFAALSGVLDHDDVLWIDYERYASQTTLTAHAQSLPSGFRWWADPAGADQIAELRLAGHDVVPCLHLGTQPLINGIAAVTQRIQTGRLKIKSTCVNLIREAGLYQYDRQTEKPVDADNHALSALRYMITGNDRGRVVLRDDQHPRIEPEREWDRREIDLDDDRFWS